MKRSSAQPRSSHRNHTPSVICLPPPKPPLTAKRDAPSEPAGAASSTQSDTQAVKRAEIRAQPMPPLSRQARRKAARAEAKAIRRRGQPVPGTPSPREMAKAAMTAAAKAPVAAPDAALAPADAPLPRDRALVANKPRGFALIVHRLRGLFIVKKIRTVPAERAQIAKQLRTLRGELAALQKSVDRMIDGVA